VAGQEEVEAVHILAVRIVAAVVFVDLVVPGDNCIGWEQSVAELAEAMFALDHGGGMNLGRNSLCAGYMCHYGEWNVVGKVACFAEIRKMNRFVSMTVVV